MSENSYKSLEDVKKAIRILEKRGRLKGDKAIHVSDHITICYEDTKSDKMILEELDL